MGVSSRHILSQGPVLSALGRTAVMATRQALGGASDATLELPTRELLSEQAPRPRALLDDYVREMGGEPRAYRGLVPPHLFPQWCFPLLTRTLEGVPYPLMGIVNGGCRVEVRAKLRDDEPLVVRAQLRSIDDDGRRAVFHQRLVTGTVSEPEAIAVDLYPIVMLSRGDDGGSNGAAKKADKVKQRARVPEDARELFRRRLGPDAGLRYAKLTGDFNPIHWIPRYARLSGFPNVIMHGFGQLALSWEGLNQHLLAGDVHALRVLDVKFTRPLPLPRDVGLYLDGNAIHFGDGPSAPSNLTGSFELNGSELRERP